MLPERDRSAGNPLYEQLVSTPVDSADAAGQPSRLGVRRRRPGIHCEGRGPCGDCGTNACPAWHDGAIGGVRILEEVRA